MENKQFEEWLKERYKFSIKNFETYPFSMQWGVYLEFFDSVGIELKTPKVYDGSPIGYKWGNWVLRSGSRHPEYVLTFKTRERAQQEAIKKAFEILEKK